jgi:anti-sigma regulatory factor (Ser/Thr protein kinase)
VSASGWSETPHARLDLPDSFSASRVARAFVSAWWSRSHLHGDLDGLLLLTSELVTNAVRHAAGPRGLLIAAELGAVRVTVSDASADPPIPAGSNLARRGGRGLALVEVLSQEWGHDVNEQGKSVWFVLAARHVDDLG